ncbi:MAG: hypothetical protein WCG08_05890 [Paludibacter sp.]
MTSFKKLKMKSILMLLFILGFTACVTDDYDLNKGLNTDIAVGGDSLTLTIAKTNKILLGSIVDPISLDILKKSSSGGYSLQIKDSTGVSVNALNPVSFSIAPISIAPINTNLASINIPSFNINPINLSSALPFPTIDISSIALPSINESYTKLFDLSKPNNVRRQVKPSGLNKSKSDLALQSTGLITFHDSKTINQALSYVYPDQLQKINSIFLKNNTVTLTFNKSDINNLGFQTQNDTITHFKLDFPAEYVLSSPTGQGTSISGNSFIINNAVLSKTLGIYVATFKIDKIDYSNYYQSPPPTIMNYTKDITYSIDYSFIGETNNPLLLLSKVNVIVSLTSGPAINDMDIQTNEFGVTVPSGSNPINQSITIPSEISKVNSITFQDGATLQLNIANPSISPFSLSAGNCVIQLPQKFIFKASPGLDLTTNTLTIPYNQLFGIKTIGISGININQNVTPGSGSISLSDNLSYSINGVKVGSQAVMVNAINGMTGKKINVTGTISSLTISNASVLTNRIDISIPDVNTSIAVNQFISNDLKKIYSLALKTPSTLEIDLNVSNMPAGIDSIFFKDYTIQFPSFIKCKTGDLNGSNQLVMNQGFKVKTGFKKTISIEKIDFGSNGLDLTNGNFVLNEAVTMKGSAYVKSSSVNSSDVAGITISPSVSVGSMTVGLIEAQISTAIQPVSQNLALNLPSFLSGGNSILDIVNPVLSLEIGNSLGIPMSIDLSLIPKKNGVAVANGTINTTIAIAPAAILGQTTWSRYWISNYCKGYSAGFDTINVALQKLLRSVPDQVEISATPSITGLKQTVDLSSTNNSVNLKFAVNVPLSFGKDFQLQYIDTIPDLQKSMADILKMTHSIDIIAVVENSIPLELSLIATALNSTNGIISGVTVSSVDKIKSGNADGTAQISTIRISLKETTTDAIKLLDKLILTVSAKNNSTVAGIQLNADQYVKLELKVQIPKGITISTTPAAAPRKK